MEVKEISMVQINGLYLTETVHLQLHQTQRSASRLHFSRRTARRTHCCRGFLLEDSQKPPQRTEVVSIFPFYFFLVLPRFDHVFKALVFLPFFFVLIQTGCAIIQLEKCIFKKSSKKMRTLLLYSTHDNHFLQTW